MRLHQRGIDLLLDLQDAIEHIDKLPIAEVQALLQRAEQVLRHLLDRDVPVPDDN